MSGNPISTLGFSVSLFARITWGTVLGVHSASSVMSRLLFIALLGLATSPLARPATLEKLTLDDLIEKSTAIVRGEAGGARVDRHGPLLYTVYEFQVEESWKGPGADVLEIALPGGRSGGREQRFGGVPALEAGDVYLLFLWTGPSGRTQITGLSQGVLRVVEGSGGELRVVRDPIDDVVFVPAVDGGVPEPDAIDMSLEEMQTRIRRTLGRPARP